MGTWKTRHKLLVVSALALGLCLGNWAAAGMHGETRIPVHQYTCEACGYNYYSFAPDRLIIDDSRFQGDQWVQNDKLREEFVKLFKSRFRHIIDNKEMTCDKKYKDIALGVHKFVKETKRDFTAEDVHKRLSSFGLDGAKQQTLTAPFRKTKCTNKGCDFQFTAFWMDDMDMRGTINMFEKMKFYNLKSGSQVKDCVSPYVHHIPDLQPGRVGMTSREVQTEIRNGKFFFSY